MNQSSAKHAVLAFLEASGKSAVVMEKVPLSRKALVTWIFSMKNIQKVICV